MQGLTGFTGIHSEHEIIFGDKYTYKVIKTEEKNGNLFIVLQQEMPNQWQSVSPIEDIFLWQPLYQACIPKRHEHTF